MHQRYRLSLESRRGSTTRDEAWQRTIGRDRTDMPMFDQRVEII